MIAQMRDVYPAFQACFEYALPRLRFQPASIDRNADLCTRCVALPFVTPTRVTLTIADQIDLTTNFRHQIIVCIKASPISNIIADFPELAVALPAKQALILRPRDRSRTAAVATL